MEPTSPAPVSPSSNKRYRRLTSNTNHRTPLKNTERPLCPRESFGSVDQAFGYSFGFSAPSWTCNWILQFRSVKCLRRLPLPLLGFLLAPVPWRYRVLVRPQTAPYRLRLGFEFGQRLIVCGV